MSAPQPRSIPQVVDRAVYQFERWLSAGLFLSMAFIMFGAVLHRVFERPESKLMAIYCWVARLTHLTNIRPADVSERTTLIFQLVTVFVILYAGVRTAKPTERWGRFNRPVAAGLAVVLTGVVVLLVYGLLTVFPNGIIWAPTYCLSSMLWIGFLGASTATYERRHLALEMGEKIWPKRILRFVQALAFLSAAAMCAFLARLAWISLSGHYEAWKLNPLTGNMPSTTFPKWIVFLIFPYTFIIMGVRFLSQAGLSATGRLAPASSQLPLPDPATTEEVRS